MFIQNAAAADIYSGYHHDPGDNAMLIQIMDPCSNKWPEPKHSFKEAHRFEFLDIETGAEGAEEFGISEEQAKQIVDLLQKAFVRQMNIIVHCHAGICRSGAVAEVGIILGFEDTGRYRQPNLRVKHALLKRLGLTYDSLEVPYAINGDLLFPTFSSGTHTNKT